MIKVLDLLREIRVVHTQRIVENVIPKGLQGFAATS